MLSNKISQPAPPDRCCISYSCIKQRRGTRSHIIYFPMDGKIPLKQYGCNLVRAELHLVTTAPPRLHPIPEQLDAVSKNKHTEMEDFSNGFYL